jgi:hypothetical protein
MRYECSVLCATRCRIASSNLRSRNIGSSTRPNLHFKDRSDPHRYGKPIPVCIHHVLARVPPRQLAVCRVADLACVLSR